MKTINKFGKTINYSVDSQYGYWMVVEDGGEEWVHATKKGIKIPNTNGNPLLCNKKGMWDLLVHFGADSSELDELFQKHI